MTEGIHALKRNLFLGQEATIKTRHGTIDWFQIGKGICQGCVLYSAYLTYMHSASCKMPGWMKPKLESILLEEISITSRYSGNTTLMAESKKELKNLLMKVKEESEKAGLNLNIQKTRIVASGPITSSQTDGEIMETVRDFIFLCSKITADGDSGHGIKRHMLLGRKAMTNLDIILKSRDMILLTKVHPVKVLVFPVAMNGCEIWTIKKAEHRKIDAFELWCWRRSFESPLDCKEIKPGNPKGSQS